jgi:asparagine synthase (glutamine-hydrolysing)
MGLRTLYFWRDSRRTAFATEVKQLLSVSFIPARLFEPAVAVFLTGPFLPLEWSFYEGITQLAPGQAILVDAISSRVWRFWDADPSKMVRYKNENDYADHFRELFKNAVASRLRTIKPVGLSLSGGMDSGSIAATAGWLFQHNQVDQVQFRAYCYAFEELSDSDERHVSQGITSYYGLTQVDIPADQLWPLKDALVHGPDRDDPYISTFQALHDAVFARAQADGTGLLLAGYRGDEIVGSWAVDYLGMLFDRQWNTLLHELNAVCRDQNIGLWSAVRSRLISPIRWALWPHPGPRAWFASQKSPRYPSWIHPEFAERVHLADLLRDRFTSPRTLRRYGWYQRYNQIFSYPPVRVAIHAERMQAKYGIAYADPWSDRRLAEFVLAIPQWVVHRYTEPKRLAHRAIQGIFPPLLSHRPAKIEPVAVYRRGMNERAKNTIFDLIDNGVADERGYIDKAALREAYEQYLCGRMPRYDFWWPLTLELWLRKFWN